MVPVFSPKASLAGAISIFNWEKQRYGTISHMKAIRIFYDKQVLPDDSVIEMVVWQLPRPEPDRQHGFKYRLYYGRNGVRLVGYDNERGKGDHRHRGTKETAYSFKSIEQLIADFIGDVKRMRGES